MEQFDDLPISTLTKKGLKKAFFIKMTNIQAKSIPFSLEGKDVLGAARTGSGKTLAFLVPVLEILYQRKWGPQDGLGALIISPTRELAVQIFEVLRSIGAYHSFSAGLIIGGKNVKDESVRLSRMNILVATPGRLLQHMDQTWGFVSDNLQVLVLDEADRILDMGFSQTLTALISHLPKQRQTLLFSATQTQSVNDLARLSLEDPVYICEEEPGYEGTTPKDLDQHYIVCELDKKLDVLWSFIKSHLQTKTLVFLSSCKQVRFVYETFRKMQPGIQLLHLHGKQKQRTRLDMYDRFTRASHAMLLATDIAARGLDFPLVDWVVQVDAPETAETYIHRVGRTARYESAGKALLFLLPSEEEGMKNALEKKGIEVAQTKIKHSKVQSVESHLQHLAFQDPEVKFLGQRAFISYLRSIFLHKDKTIFKLDELPVERFAQSLGLPGTPKIKFLKKDGAKTRGSLIHVTEADTEDEDEHGDSNQGGSGVEGGLERLSPSPAESPTAEVQSKQPAARTKYDRMFGRKNQNILSEPYRKLIDDSASEAEEDFITLKRADHDLPSSLTPELHRKELSKRQLKLGKAKRAIAKYGSLGKKLIFDDEGEAHELYEPREADEIYRDEGVEGVMNAGRKFAEGERERMVETNIIDKMEAREKKKEKKRKKKRDKGVEDVPTGPAIAPPLEDDGYVSPAFDLSSTDERPEPKRKKPASKPKLDSKRTLEDDERLALRLLHGQ